MCIIVLSDVQIIHFITLFIIIANLPVIEFKDGNIV